MGELFNRRSTGSWGQSNNGGWSYPRQAPYQPRPRPPYQNNQSDRSGPLSLMASNFNTTRGEIGSLGTMCNVAQALAKNGITGQCAVPTPA
eukprot:5487259-Karenia_brevis.AAC.1